MTNTNDTWLTRDLQIHHSAYRVEHLKQNVFLCSLPIIWLVLIAIRNAAVIYLQNVAYIDVQRYSVNGNQCRLVCA